MQIQRAAKLTSIIQGGAHAFLKRLGQDESGQDLIEYTLLLAFVCLASAAIFISAGTTLNAIWQTTNTVLSNANIASS